jgi:hypothetical protein
MLHWLFLTAGVAVAAAAWVRVRRLAKRLERLTESYWELRYEQGQLRSRLAKIEPPAATATEVERRIPPTPGTAGTQFVPLASLRGHTLNR